jgi:hypothetical protein
MWIRFKQWVIVRVWGWYELQRWAWICLRDPHRVRNEMLDNVLDIALEVEDKRIMVFMEQLDYMTGKDKPKSIH